MISRLTGTIKKASSLGYGFNGITVFESDGTWTRPPWCRAIFVIVTSGGGGGGAGVNGGTAVGASGAGGGTEMSFLTEKDITNATETVTIGAGGLDYIQQNWGSNGGTSSFGSHISVSGGASSNGIGASGSDINFGSAGGKPPIGVSGNVGGHGMMSFRGGGAEGGLEATNGNFGNSTCFGAGGPSGAGNGANPNTGEGGHGAPGVVVVYEFA